MACRMKSRQRYINKLVGQFEHQPDLKTYMCKQLKGCSYADVEQIVLKAKRKAIITDSPLHEQLITDAYDEYMPRLLST